MRCNLLWFILVLAACTPTTQPPPVPPPPPDASDAALAPPPGIDPTCGIACATMASIGCSEGKSATCAISMTKVQTDRLIRLPTGAPMTCAGCAAAKTEADVVAQCASSCTP